MDDLLPIGSVVLLRGGMKKVMICGRLQRQESTNKVWDYSACLYPEGIIDPQNLYLFNNDSIDRLYFIGMQDAEELEFRRILLEHMSEIGEAERAVGENA
jgi:hypothetical protein